MRGNNRDVQGGDTDRDAKGRHTRGDIGWELMKGTYGGTGWYTRWSYSIWPQKGYTGDTVRHRRMTDT